MTCLGVNFVRKKFTLLPITIGICRSENIKKILGVNFTFEICQGVNRIIKVENLWQVSFSIVHVFYFILSEGLEQRIILLTQSREK